jgi:hypothetical protein
LLNPLYFDLWELPENVDYGIVLCGEISLNLSPSYIAYMWILGLPPRERKSNSLSTTDPFAHIKDCRRN